MIKSFNQLTLSKAIILDNLGESDLIIGKDLEAGQRLSGGEVGSGRQIQKQLEGRNCTCEILTASVCALGLQPTCNLSFTMNELPYKSWIY